MKVPYLPQGRTLRYVSLENPYMRQAQKVAQTQSLDPDHPTGAVIVKKGEIIGQGANGSNYHQKNGCERKKQNIPTGKNYELCPGCHPRNHAEQKALQNALDQKKNPENADLYLWGHWWCCESCWEKMISHKIKEVYLLQDAEKFFRS